MCRRKTEGWSRLSSLFITVRMFLTQRLEYSRSAVFELRAVINRRWFRRRFRWEDFTIWETRFKNKGLSEGKRWCRRCSEFWHREVSRWTDSVLRSGWSMVKAKARIADTAFSERGCRPGLLRCDLRIYQAGHAAGSGNGELDSWPGFCRSCARKLDKLLYGHRAKERYQRCWGIWSRSRTNGRWWLAPLVEDRFSERIRILSPKILLFTYSMVKITHWMMKKCMRQSWFAWKK